jgi:DNA-binding CsgD family transcriptional regulator
VVIGDGSWANMSNLALISRDVAEILPAAGTDEFAPSVVAMLRDQVNIDEACMIVYPRDESPRIAHRETQKPGDEPNLDTFIKGPFLLDPYYVAAAREGRFGFFPLSHLAPTGFKTSEYYRTYYRFSGIFDECGYLTPIGDGGFANLSLARADGNQPFESSTLRCLADLAPLVTALTQHHWRLLPANPSTEQISLRTQLESVLESFGESVLTARERQIINSILHGHTSKAIAQSLAISVETVKLHRKNAYRKLAIRNQSELFYTFIRALRDCSDEYQGGDPLR